MNDNAAITAGVKAGGDGPRQPDKSDLRIRIFMSKNRKLYAQISVRSRVKTDSLAQQEVHLDDTAEQILRTVEWAAGACAEYQNNVLGDDHTCEHFAWAARDSMQELVDYMKRHKLDMQQHIDTVVRHGLFYKPLAEIGKVLYAH